MTAVVSTYKTKVLMEQARNDYTCAGCAKAISQGSPYYSVIIAFEEYRTHRYHKHCSGTVRASTKFIDDAKFTTTTKRG